LARTTVQLDPALLAQVERLSAASSQSVETTVERLLRRGLRASKAVPRRAQTPRWHVVKGGAPAPGFDPASRDYLNLLDPNR
jgi:hypothetical protein